MATVETMEGERTLDQVRTELAKAQSEERALVEEVQEVAEQAEQAIESGDTRAIRKVAARRAELPLLLAAAIRHRARLAVEVVEGELREVEAERPAANREVFAAREAERLAREAREEAEAVVGDLQARVHGVRDELRRAREALDTVKNINPDDLLQRGTNAV